MRIRNRRAAADCSVIPSSSSAAHSPASSQDSSSSCQLSPAALPRCRGLDLLVKAIHQVDAGSVVGVPYIQRRVTIRRRRRSGRIDFDAFGFRRRTRAAIAEKLSSTSKKANKD